MSLFSISTLSIVLLLTEVQSVSKGIDIKQEYTSDDFKCFSKDLSFVVIRSWFFEDGASSGKFDENANKNIPAAASGYNQDTTDIYMVPCVGSDDA